MVFEPDTQKERWIRTVTFRRLLFFLSFFRPSPSPLTVCTRCCKKRAPGASFDCMLKSTFSISVYGNHVVIANYTAPTKYDIVADASSS
ncbi:hypothetical protein SERLADRAFT_467594 [Serpula lacrymans var. lacrymans S7.9]|uniref:Uncharacterized protein n=1 Tax=Serpula lacrymans var. lacrymans (strain S7.9) TaxID=578457 RepID=F8NWP1_SERL9|nr:uncharacterized protein SERLADRAFT_467594 [Serpula lacrymans var. lacrymans S7.9]EGO24393.1 hypothetical protein SERLADRAFT_467594 [Serpula lacrymans var. lacrymans S7.9]